MKNKTKYAELRIQQLTEKLSITFKKEKSNYIAQISEETYYKISQIADDLFRIEYIDEDGISMGIYSSNLETAKWIVLVDIGIKDCEYILLALLYCIDELKPQKDDRFIKIVKSINTDVGFHVDELDEIFDMEQEEEEEDELEGYKITRR